MNRWLKIVIDKDCECVGKCPFGGKTIYICDEGEKVYTEKDMQDILHAVIKKVIGLAKQRVLLFSL